MPQMERNLDLESVDADTLFGIEALRHQSIGQKILFYGCLAGGILANTLMPRILHTPGWANVLIFTALLAIGIAGGCNYTQDISYGKYLCCMLFEKKTVLPYAGDEQIVKGKQVKKEDQNESKKMTLKAVLIILMLAAVLAGLKVWQGQREAGEHYQIEERGNNE